MKHFLDSDNELEKAERDFKNYLGSSTCRFSEHEKAVLRKLVDTVSSRAYSAGYDNCRFDMND
jgi:hypothetical protein